MPIRNVPFLYLLCLFATSYSLRLGLYGGITPVYESAFQCLKNNGVQQITFYFPHTSLIDDLGKFIPTLMKAKNMGLKVQLLYMACREANYSMIVENLKKLNVVGIDRYWLTPHTFSTQCRWGSKYTPTQHCQYLQLLVNQMKKNNLPIGITSNSQTWKLIFSTTCNIFSNQMLYWFLYPNSDTDQTLNHFVPFGGWYAAQMKSYICPNLCGLDQYINYCNSIFY